MMKVNLDGRNARNQEGLTANYEKSIKELLAAGKFDWVDEEIIFADFQPSEEHLQQRMRYIKRGIERLGRSHNQKEIFEAVVNKSARFSTPHELLQFAVEFPIAQRVNPIVTLCLPGKDTISHQMKIKENHEHFSSMLETFNNSFLVLALTGSAKGRGVSLFHFNVDLSKKCRFLCVYN